MSGREDEGNGSLNRRPAKVTRQLIDVAQRVGSQKGGSANKPEAAVASVHPPGGKRKLKREGA